MRICSGRLCCVVLAMVLASLPGHAAPDEAPPGPIATTVSVTPRVLPTPPEAFQQEPGERVRLLWQTAREHVRRGEVLVGHETDPARDAFEQARELTSQALAEDPECAECCAVRFSATGRLASLVGVKGGLRLAREAGALLDQCLAHPPLTVGPTPQLSERTRLFLSAAQYYRRLPRSGLLAWLLGQRRDPERASVLARQAWQQAPHAGELRLELAVSLLCLAESEDQQAPRDEGRALLRALSHDEQASPVMRVLAAELVIDSPKPCDFDLSDPRGTVSLAY